MSKTMTISEQLKDARIRLGMTQKEVASEFGCTKWMISRWECGFIPRKDGIKKKIINDFIKRADGKEPAPTDAGGRVYHEGRRGRPKNETATTS